MQNGETLLERFSVLHTILSLFDILPKFRYHPIG